MKSCSILLFAFLTGCYSCHGSSAESKFEICSDVSIPATAKSAGAIAWAGDSVAYVVTDDRPSKLYEFKLAFDDNRVLESVEASLLGTPQNAVDSEAIDYDFANRTIWIAHEVGSSILNYDVKDSTFKVIGKVPMPDIISKARTGRSLESLALSKDGLTLFTCTEEALRCDGPGATRSNGTWVRLIKFTRATPAAEWVEAGQWAYMTEKIQGGPWKTKSGDASRNGVSALTIANDGTLYLLERDFSTRFLPVMDCRIYEIDFSKATDVRKLSTLSGEEKFEPVTKKEVFRVCGLAMYEGLCNGPMLKDGSESFFLCSDGGRGTPARILQIKTKAPKK